MPLGVGDVGGSPGLSLVLAAVAVGDADVSTVDRDGAREVAFCPPPHATTSATHSRTAIRLSLTRGC